MIHYPSKLVNPLKLRANNFQENLINGLPT